jgi:membrane protein implicated in regulation of membrane protease activity
MLDFLLTDLHWWHWIIFGLVLIVFELIVPHFVLIWFGLSAVIVGVVENFFETAFIVDFAIWIALSLMLLALWYLRFRPQNSSKDSLETGQANFHTDAIGKVTEPIMMGHKGRVHFASPVLGSSDWAAISKEPLEVGTRVRIIEINGQLLKVKKG